ncbi:MAG: PepSY-associated TM helix domain-containing protein [Pseudomonadota bacterium]
MSNNTGLHGAFRQSMSWLHTWCGLVLSLVLYFIFITGSFGYFNYEIDHWMKPENPSISETASADDMLETGFGYLREEAPAASRYFVTLPVGRGNPGIRVFAQLDEPTDSGAMRLSEQININGEVLSGARDTGGGNALYRMHYALHYMPYNLAIYIVGVSTLFMFLAIITGIIVHKNIFKDFFTLRLGKGQRSWLDGHNISSVLALPFMLMITYSGLVFYEFEYSPGTLFLGMGVDQDSLDEMFEHLRPGSTAPDPSGNPAPFPDISGPLAQAQAQWPGSEIRFVQVDHPGDTAAIVTISRVVEGLGRRGASLKFDGITGAPLSPHQSAPPNAAFSGAVLALHEGRFANAWLRWAYFISGLLGAAMIATGLLLWAKKRRSKLRSNISAPTSLVFVERTNLGIIVGLPLGVAAYFWANRLLPVDMNNRAEWELHCLFLMWAFSFMHAGARELRRAWREQVALLAVLFLLLPVVNAVTTEVHLVNSLAQGDWVRAAFDLSALVFGLIMYLVWRKLTPAPARSIHYPGASELVGRSKEADA